MIAVKTIRVVPTKTVAADMFRDVMGDVIVVLGVTIRGNGGGPCVNRFVGVVHRQSK